MKKLVIESEKMTKTEKLSLFFFAIAAFALTFFLVGSCYIVACSLYGIDAVSSKMDLIPFVSLILIAGICFPISWSIDNKLEKNGFKNDRKNKEAEILQVA